MLFCSIKITCLFPTGFSPPGCLLRCKKRRLVIAKGRASPLMKKTCFIDEYAVSITAKILRTDQDEKN
jgi:hypothetical protein